MCIELVGWVLEARLVLMGPVLVGLFYLVVFFKHCLVDELACESVPKRHNVEPIHCSQNVVLLTPN